MLTTLVAVLLSTSLDCVDQRSFSWPGSSLPVLGDDVIRIRALVWAPASADAFVMELPGGDRVLVGQRAGTNPIKSVTGWKMDGAELLLPLAQNQAVLTQWGVGAGCRVTSMGRDLGGPIPANVKIDARKKWRFEVRDRSMKEVLFSF